MTESLNNLIQATEQISMLCSVLINSLLILVYDVNRF